MRTQIQTFFNSFVSAVSMLLIAGSLLLSTLLLQINGGWTPFGVGVTVAGGVVLAAWIVWGIYVIARKKKVFAMAFLPRIIIEACTSLIMTWWIYIVSSSVLIAVLWFGFYLSLGSDL